MPRHTPSSTRWLKEHEADPYVLAARQAGWRSRAAFKLLEIDERLHLLRPGLTVVDLGAAPGGWSQVAAGKIGAAGRVVAVDLLAMDPLLLFPGLRGNGQPAPVVFIQGDFLSDAVVGQIHAALATHGRTPGFADLLLSDMAPNLSGISVVDQAREEGLALAALEAAEALLRPGGDLLLKLFHGAGFQEPLREARARFTSVKVVKPQASRSRSPEHYLVALGFRPAVPSSRSVA